MGYTIYDSAARSMQNALNVLHSLRHRDTITDITVNDIRLSRRTRAIALQTTFSELSQAFITPIDREDLLELRQLTERILRASEDVILTLYAHGQSAPTSDDTAALTAVTKECTLLYEAVDAIASYPRSDTVIDKLTAAEQQHWLYQDFDSSPTHHAIRQLSDTCYHTTEHLLRILLKMT